MKHKSSSKKRRDRKRTEQRYARKLNRCDKDCDNCNNWRCYLRKTMWRTAFRDPENNEVVCLITPIDPYFASVKIPIRKGDVLTQGVRYTHPALRYL